MIDCNVSVVTWKNPLRLQKKNFIFVCLANYLIHLLQQKLTGQYLKPSLMVKNFFNPLLVVNGKFLTNF